MANRQMTSDGRARYTVSENGVVLATEVPFDVAHEFVHDGCTLCAANEDHFAPAAAS